VSQRRVIQEDEAENSLNQSSSKQSSSNQSSNADSVKPIPKKKTTVVRPKITKSSEKKASNKNEKNEKVISPISGIEVQLAKIEKRLKKTDLIVVVRSLKEWITEEHYGDDFLQHLKGNDVDLFQSK